MHAPTHTNQDKLALLIGYSCASSRFPITSLTLTKYSVWPSCHKFQNLPSQKLLKLLPIISRQFRAFGDKKSTPFSHPLLSDSLVLAVTTRRIGQKTRVFYCCLQWVGGGGEKKEKFFLIKAFRIYRGFLPTPTMTLLYRNHAKRHDSHLLP